MDKIPPSMPETQGPLEIEKGVGAILPKTHRVLRLKFFLAILILPILFSGYIQDRRYHSSSIRSQMEYGRSLKDEGAFRSQQAQIKGQAFTQWEQQDLAALLAEGREKYLLANGVAPDSGALGQIEDEARSLVASWEAQLVADLTAEYGAFKARASAGPSAGILAAALSSIKNAILGAAAEGDALAGSDVESDLAAWRALVDAPSTAAVAQAKATLKVHYDESRSASELSGGGLAAYISALDAREESDARALEEAGAMIRERAFNAFVWKRRLAEALKNGIQVGGVVFSTNGELFSGESPDKIALGAASGVASDLSAGLEGILADMGYRLGGAENAPIEIASLRSDYQKRIAEELNRGLAQWEDAEIRLSQAFEAWNDKNTEDYLTGARLWADAFSQFRLKQETWKAKIEGQIASGIVLWDRALAQMEVEQKRAYDDLNGLIQAKQGNFEEYFGNLSGDLSTAAGLEASLTRSKRGFEDLISQTIGNGNAAAGFQWASHPGGVWDPGGSLKSDGNLNTPYYHLKPRDMVVFDAFGNVIPNPLEIDIRLDRVNYWEYAPTSIAQNWRREVRRNEDRSLSYRYVCDYGVTQSRVERVLDIFAGYQYKTIDTYSFSQTWSSPWRDETDDYFATGWGSDPLLLIHTYEEQLSNVEKLQANVASSFASLFAEYGNLLRGNATGQGLFADSGSPGDLFYRTADEWDLHRLSQEIEAASWKVERTVAICAAFSNRSWDAARLALAEAEFESARASYAAKQLSYSNARAVADSFGSNQVATCLTNLGILGKASTAERILYQAAASNYFVAVSKLQSNLISAVDFQAQENAFNLAKIRQDRTNQAFEDARTAYNISNAAWFQMGALADSAYADLVAAERGLQVKEDLYNTLKYIDSLDGERLLQDHRSAMDALAALVGQKATVQACLSSLSNFNLQPLSGNASLGVSFTNLAFLERERNREMATGGGGQYLGGGLLWFLGWQSANLIAYKPATNVVIETGFQVESNSYFSSEVDFSALNLSPFQSAPVLMVGRAWSNLDQLWNLVERRRRGDDLEADWTVNQVLKSGDKALVFKSTYGIGMGLTGYRVVAEDYFGATVSNRVNMAPGLNSFLSTLINNLDANYVADQFKLRQAKSWGLKVEESRDRFLECLSDAIDHEVGLIQTNLGGLSSAVSNALLTGSYNSREIYGAFADFLYGQMGATRAIFPSGNAFGLAQQALSGILPQLISSNLQQEAKSQVASMERQIALVIAEKANWFATLSDVFNHSTAAWKASEDEMVSAENEWNNQYLEKTYFARLAWKARNDQLNAHKRLWVETAQKNIETEQEGAFLAELRKTSDDLIGRSFENLPGPIEIEGASVKTREAVLSRLENLARAEIGDALASRASRLNLAFGTSEIGKLIFSGNEVIHAGLMAAMKEGEEIALRLQISQMFEATSQSARARETAINQMDVGTGEGIEESLRQQGYEKQGAQWKRVAVVDSTLWGDKTQEQFVDAWKFLAKVRVPFKYTLKDLLSRSIEAANYLLEEASKSITSVYEEYMGKESDFTAGIPIDGIYNTAAMWKHVGRSPEFSSDGEDPMQVTKEGKWQLGIISTSMRQHGIAAGRGEQAKNTPFWKKKMWDDTDPDGKKDKNKLAAPSLFSVVSIATSVALAATGVGAVASGGIMAALTATETVATGAFYGRSAAEIALDTVKGVAVAGVGMLTAGIGSAVTSSLSTVANIATQAGFGAARAAINTGVGAVVNAVHLDSRGALAFDTSREYWQSAAGSLISGSLMGAVAGAVSTIGATARGPGDTQIKNFIGFKTGSSGLNGFLNGLTRGAITTAANYGIQNAVGALEQHWNTGSFEGYQGTKFQWGSAMADIIGEGVGSGITAAGGSDILSQLGTMVSRKAAYFVANTAQYFTQGGSAQAFAQMKGIDMVGGLSASFGVRNANTGAFSQIFGLSLTGEGLSLGWGPTFGKSDMTFAADMGQAAAQRRQEKERAEMAARMKREREEKERGEVPGAVGVLPSMRGNRREDGDLSEEEMRDGIRNDLRGTTRADLGALLRERTGGEDYENLTPSQRLFHDEIMGRLDELDRVRGISTQIRDGQEVSQNDLDFLEKNALDMHDRQLAVATTDAFTKLIDSSTSNADRMKVWQGLNTEQQGALQTLVQMAGGGNQRINRTEEWNKDLPWYIGPVTPNDAWDSTLMQRTADRMCNLTTLAMQLQQVGIANPSRTLGFADYLDSAIKGDPTMRSRYSIADHQAARESDENRVELSKRLGAILKITPSPVVTDISSARMRFDDIARSYGSVAITFRDRHWVTFAGHDNNGVYINNPLGYYRQGAGYELNTENCNYGYMNFYTWQQVIDLQIGNGAYGKISRAVKN